MLHPIHGLRQWGADLVGCGFRIRGISGILVFYFEVFGQNLVGIAVVQAQLKIEVEKVVDISIPDSGHGEDVMSVPAGPFAYPFSLVVPATLSLTLGRR